MRYRWTLALVLLLAGCMHPPPLEAPAGVQLTPLRTISTLEARIALSAAGVDGLPVEHAIDTYRMDYVSRQPDGKPVWLSGLLALPRGAAPVRIASFQHGTATSRTDVPSQLDLTGTAAAIAFAGNGYALIAPDYPGLGVGPGKHPYYVKDEVAASVTGMIEAARRLPGMPSLPVFLAGFSEGGWATIAALQSLEAAGKPVIGAAPVAGVYDIRGISLPASLKGGSPSASTYLAYIAWAYADAYDQPLDSVLKPDIAAKVETLFAEGNPDTIKAALPSDPRAMFTDDFLAAVHSGDSHWLLDAIAHNGLTDVTPESPVRLYYGTADQDVSPGESITAARAMKARGADAEAIDVGAVDHPGSMLAAAPMIFAWLTALEAANAPATSASQDRTVMVHEGSGPSTP